MKDKVLKNMLKKDNLYNYYLKASKEEQNLIEEKYKNTMYYAYYNSIDKLKKFIKEFSKTSIIKFIYKNRFYIMWFYIGFILCLIFAFLGWVFE